MTDDKVTSVVGRPNQGFKKVIEHIDNHVIRMHHVFRRIVHIMFPVQRNPPLSLSVCGTSTM